MMQLYQGKAAFSEATNLQEEQPTHDFKLKVDRVFLTKELSDFFNRVIPLLPLPLGQLEGVLNADAELSARGTQPEELFAGLNGSGTATMPENLRLMMPVFRRVPGLGKYSDLELATMDSSFTIKNGLSDSKTTFKADDLTMELTGTTNLVKRKVPGIELPGREIDYSVSLSGDRVGRDLRRFLNKKGELPVKIKGTLEQPKAKLVVAGILGPLLEGLLK